jgi:signal transduction histidine kinase
MKSTTSHAARVAGVATALGMVSFIVIVLVLNSFLINRVTSQVDQRLRDRLGIVEHVLQQNPSSNTSLITTRSGDGDNDDAPIFVWLVTLNDSATPLTGVAPRLPHEKWSNGTRTLTITTSTFRLDAVTYKTGWLVDAESLAEVIRLRNTLELAESVAGLVLMVLMFGAAFVVGIRALAPVSLAKQRQSEFVADASHELRTPLSVIEAEVDVALARERDGAGYRSALQRVKGESGRLRHIVEDLLWLARSDDGRGTVTPLELIEVGSIAELSTTRFQSLAASSGITLSCVITGEGSGIIEASVELVDRLVGVLIDNALKFTGIGGRVEVSVIALADRVTLRVDDSGPGIAPEERSKIFERFQHANSTLGGTGLGLAIASSIAHVTHATYAVSEAEIGGARFEFHWRASGNESSN